MSGGGDILEHLVRFGRMLRAHGIAVGISEEVDAASALRLVDVADRDEVRLALRTAFRIAHRDWGTYDELFSSFWKEHADPRCSDDKPPKNRLASDRSTLPPSSSVGSQPAVAALLDEPETEGEMPGYSSQALLRRKPFEECTDAELAQMQRLLARLIVQMATRRSRRLVPTPARGLVDLRRSLRRAVSTEGELISLARRGRAIEEPRLVLLCDTSGSMDLHCRFLLAFAVGLKRAARHTEVFVFNTALTRITPWLSSARLEVIFDRLATGVPDWSGGTRIGACLMEFVHRYRAQVVNSRTVVVILSDGLDGGESGELVEAMEEIKARARRVIWLNPLAGDPRYRPEARGMKAALPFVDQFAPAHNLESLEQLMPALGA